MFHHLLIVGGLYNLWALRSFMVFCLTFPSFLSTLALPKIFVNLFLNSVMNGYRIQWIQLQICSVSLWCSSLSRCLVLRRFCHWVWVLLLLKLVLLQWYLPVLFWWYLPSFSPPCGSCPSIGLVLRMCTHRGWPFWMVQFALLWWYLPLLQWYLPL